MEDSKGPPSTWGELLVGYCEEKAGPGPVLNPQFRFTRKKGGAVKSRERLFNPVTQRHVHGDTEKAVREAEEKKLIESINKGMKGSITLHSHVGYDIISQRPKFGIQALESFGTEAASQKGKRTEGVRPPGTHVDYDIVTLQGFTGTSSDLGTTQSTVQRGRFTRQYNIVSHRYATDHEERAKAKDEAVRDRHKKLTAEGYDPIRGVYCNAAKEAAELQRTIASGEAKKGELHTTTHKTPSAIRRSEGHNYDILIGHVHSMEAVDHIDKLTRRGVAPRVALRSKVASQLEATEATIAKAEARALNKVSTQRKTDACRSGYDILSNRPVSLPPVPRSTWDVLGANR
eukprot:TRINITY_DN20927_c0_g1_i1.p1 TRINITY_DN20927_c0_g1~~TRINITY_DN20927_c0_g1_i1.p1  ORF type:complete len:368 (+),score=48.08 TRINITY_DN20927_c0_g1_i1:70-1104(+)